MDTQTFWQEIGKISSEFDISNHHQEFLKEAGCVAELYWKGWDAMLQ